MTTACFKKWLKFIQELFVLVCFYPPSCSARFPRETILWTSSESSCRVIIRPKFLPSSDAACQIPMKLRGSVFFSNWKQTAQKNISKCHATFSEVVITSPKTLYPCCSQNCSQSCHLGSATGASKPTHPRSITGFSSAELLPVHTLHAQCFSIIQLFCAVCSVYHGDVLLCSVFSHFLARRVICERSYKVSCWWWFWFGWPRSLRQDKLMSCLHQRQKKGFHVYEM